MRSTESVPELSSGWSFPITSSEVAAYFPGVGYVSWYRSNPGKIADWGDRDEPLFSLSWHPRSTTAQPVLMIWAAPTMDRVGIRAWLEKSVESEAKLWLASLASQDLDWRDREHIRRWKWRPVPKVK